MSGRPSPPSARFEPWAGLLRDCARRGIRAPVPAVGGGAPGFLEAPREVFSDTREQRCRVHETADVLDPMPKTARPAAKKAVRDIHDAEDANTPVRPSRPSPDSKAPSPGRLCAVSVDALGGHRFMRMARRWSASCLPS
ncbi:hypothetical protein Slala03_74630 [Streptomyces lavendulae subsp. lavendulae]|nr:hypothetical protein Slala03_74630 [Streptomyces lavendulae subsp. lavendulae]